MKTSRSVSFLNVKLLCFSNITWQIVVELRSFATCVITISRFYLHYHLIRLREFLSFPLNYKLSIRPGFKLKDTANYSQITSFVLLGIVQESEISQRTVNDLKYLQFVYCE